MLRLSFEETGFTSVRNENTIVTTEFDSPEMYIDFLKEISVPIRSIMKQQPTKLQEALWIMILEEARSHADDDGQVHFDNESILIVGQK